MKAARIYIRVSTSDQDAQRQKALIEHTHALGYYIAGTYEDIGTGTNHDRPALQRLIGDIQPGDVVIAEKIDRITRAPLEEAEALIQAMRDKGAVLSIPGLMDLSEITATGMTKIVLDAMQDMLLRLTLQQARDDYETRRQRQAEGIAIAKAKGKYQGRQRNHKLRDDIQRALQSGWGVRETARRLGVSPTTVSKVKAEQA